MRGRASFPSTTGLFCSSNRPDVDGYRDAVLAASEEDAADRADVIEVAAIGNCDMLGRIHQIVGGIKVDPSSLRLPDRNPCVGGVATFEFGLAFGRVR